LVTSIRDIPKVSGPTSDPAVAVNVVPKGSDAGEVGGEVNTRVFGLGDAVVLKV